MKFSAASLLLLSTATAWIVPPPALKSSTKVEAPPATEAVPVKELVQCALDSPHPCNCPEGTSYIHINTWWTWGANAFDVYKLVGNFSDLSWVPQPIKITIGPENTVGSLRLTTIQGDVGAFDWLEQLTDYYVKEDGSFLWAFELRNVPLAFPNGSGRFAGEWVRFDARAVNEHETSVNWNLYGCHTGGTHTYPVFQRYIWEHIHEILSKKGKITGNSSEPYTEIEMGHRSSTVTSKDDVPVLSYEDQQFILARTGVRLESSRKDL